MARSNKPLVWSLFAAGGTLAAFVMPVLVLLTLMAGYGNIPTGLTYEAMHAFAAGWLGKAILFLIISLSLWHAAHRMRIALHGLGVRAEMAVALINYGIAAAGTILSLFFLLRM